MKWFTLRAWLVLVGILVMGSLNAFLISKEHVETVLVEEYDVEYDDRLGDLVYSKSNRAQNLESFGLNSEQIRDSKKYFRRFEKMERQIKARLKNDETGMMPDIFCSRTDEIRPRYAAIGYLIMSENGERIVWNPKQQKEFELQAWASPYSLETIYEDIEKARDELPSSTAMVVTAFMSSSENDLIDRQEPWGRSGRSWSWATVQKRFDKYVDGTVQYLSLMHYITELANTEEGICQ